MKMRLMKNRKPSACAGVKISYPAGSRLMLRTTASKNQAANPAYSATATTAWCTGHPKSTSVIPYPPGT